MPFKSNAPALELEPRDPAAYPKHPQRDARAVRPVYMFEDAEDAVLDSVAASDHAPEPYQNGPVQVQQPRDPEAYSALPSRS